MDKRQLEKISSEKPAMRWSRSILPAAPRSDESETTRIFSSGKGTFSLHEIESKVPRYPGLQFEFNYSA